MPHIGASQIFSEHDKGLRWTSAAKQLAIYNPDDSGSERCSLVPALILQADARQEPRLACPLQGTSAPEHEQILFVRPIQWSADGSQLAVTIGTQSTAPIPAAGDRRRPIKVHVQIHEAQQGQVLFRQEVFWEMLGEGPILPFLPDRHAESAFLGILHPAWLPSRPLQLAIWVGAQEDVHYRHEQSGGLHPPRACLIDMHLFEVASRASHRQLGVLKIR